MYFKINKPEKDKYTDMGMVNISADFYLEKGDNGWKKYQEEHHVIAPIFPEEGYQGQVDENGRPTNKEDYNNWLSSLPTEERDNSFCNHSIQFEENVTEEEILWCFEFALEQTYLNYLANDLHCKTLGKVVNQNINYLSRKSFYEDIKRIPISQQNDDIKSKLLKCINAEDKAKVLKDVDFSEIKTIGKYRVKK